MPSKNKNEEIPPGFTLRRFLKGHGDVINRIAWSHNGMFIASPSHDGTIRIWNAQTGQELRTLKGHKGNVNSIAWSPESRVLASVSSSEEAVLLWDVPTGKALDPLEGHSWGVYSIAWSPDGNILASGSLDQTVRLWDAKTGQLLRTFSELSGTVINLEWSPNGNILAVGSDVQAVRLWNVQTDKVLPIPIGAYDVYTIAWSPDGTMLATDYGYDTIQLWNVNTRQRVHILEGHTAPVRCVAFSFDGRLLASKSADWTVRIWRTDTWEPVAVLQEPASNFAFTGLAFHPKDPVLATLGDYDKVIRIWDLDMAVLLGIQPRAQAVHYSNAKVVLVGDSGVGKSGLGLALTGQSFVPTESTHGRHIWTLNSWEIDCGEYKETRETLLWDLAGQPGYRLIHQLHLSEVAVALIVFDSHSESDPFAGVNHWVRALRLSELSQENSVKSMKKFLVAARVDRGGTSASRQRINMLMQQLGLDGYFETSAKEGWNISALAEAISQAIDWQILTKTTSTELFQRIKTFLVAEKTAGRLLSTYNDLCRTFQTSQDKQVESENIVGEFKTCIGQLESQGLIRQLSFGNLVLLQPELLDAYASALINAVRDEPDGLGSISEAMIWAGKFAVPSDERIKDREKEKLLLIAMVEDLLRYEIALREESEDGAYLVFPSQSTRENPDLPDPEGKAVIFGFEGPVLNIYATLAVRLSHSGLFKKKELWKNAVTYTTDAGGMYGIFLHNMGEGRAELTLFFDKLTFRLK